jgi:hypothetical protein
MVVYAPCEHKKTPHCMALVGLMKAQSFAG